MRAFNFGTMPAAALVLLLMNVATIFPLWPGNVGLMQAAIALPLVSYGVAYGTGFAFGLALQAVEMSVGVGLGLVFLAREGISFAGLKGVRDDREDDEPSGETVLLDVDATVEEPSVEAEESEPVRASSRR
jgi:hypothetical protein